MEINGVLKGGLLEDSATALNPNEIGAITTGAMIASDIHSALGDVRPVYIGDGTLKSRVAFASEVIQADAKLSSDISQTNLRVTAIEESMSAGANTTILQNLSAYSFSSCSIGTQPPYTFLRLLSSSSATSSISKNISLGYILSTSTNAGGLSSNEIRLIADNSLEFSVPPLAWSYDLTQSQTHAAPYTVIESFSSTHVIDSSLFTDKHDSSDVGLSFYGLATSQTDAICRLDPTVSVVSVYDVVSGSPVISRVEFIVDGYKKYVMPYDTFVALPSIPFTLTFRHNYYGDRDTFSFISGSGHSFFKARLTSRIYRL